ncbi:hypothetical protein HRR86_003809 [Exophiala dermatitidis]|nr:hypothetical protein HRR76_005634 [Exophiala dermatitidis]KAJ4627609.1 hypothetical protein HRR86_003809 [Exophiala dermatitidis]
MLGARARAAEYNAAKAASARQASREAEEQKLPPKPVPISLSAFTKNTQPNRNKGAKAYVPLVLEDTPEGNKQGLDEEKDESMAATPTHQAHAVDRGPASQEVETPLGPRNPQPVRAAPAVPAQTAPKAMIASAAEATQGLANATPYHIQPHSTFTQSQETVPLSVNSSPGAPHGTSYPAYIPPRPLLGNTMGPSDISPSKQEHKFAMLSQKYIHPHMVTGATPHLYPATPSMQGRSSMVTDPYAAATPGWNANQPFSGFEQMPSQRQIFQNFNSDEILSAPPAREPRIASPMHNAALAVGSSAANTDDSFPPPAAAEETTAEVATLRLLRLTVATPDDEPYDRNSKMQNFVAAQQALAKTGKTVLHNPELHRVKATAGGGPAPTDAIATALEHQVKAEAKKNDDGQISRALLRPPPGFEFKADGIPTLAVLREGEASDPSPMDSETLRKEFAVGTDDWLELRPVTRSERLKMNKAMRLCSTTMQADAPKALVAQGQDRRAKLLREPEVDKASDHGGMKMWEQIAEDHVADRLAKSPGGDEVMGAGPSKLDVEKASILKVGQIWNNLASHTASDATSADNDAFPPKYKPAPEYAIERGHLLSGESGSTSFFEEDTGGFYNAPSRIARDPRFRPTGKEGFKSKSEEDWKHRSDMYGRRRL